jgi:hypothetical protein
MDDATANFLNVQLADNQAFEASCRAPADLVLMGRSIAAHSMSRCKYALLAGPQKAQADAWLREHFPPPEG